MRFAMRLAMQWIVTLMTGGQGSLVLNQSRREGRFRINDLDFGRLLVLSHPGKTGTARFEKALRLLMVPFRGLYLFVCLFSLLHLFAP